MTHSTPETLSANAPTKRHLAHAAFIIGVLTQQEVIRFEPDAESMDQHSYGVLLVAHCLTLLPDNGDWPALPFALTKSE